MFDNLPEKVTLIEVGPRDGLQNVSQPVATEDKVTFIQLLIASGLSNIELSSFVHPKWVPQLADSRDVVGRVLEMELPDPPSFSCLVPNMKGLNAALESGVKEIAVFLASSETFSKKNINAGVDESFEKVAPVVEKARAASIAVRGYLSTVFTCPYEGAIQAERVVTLCKRMLELGVYEVSLGDTTGGGGPLEVQRLLRLLDEAGVARDQLALHFHDTRGLAVANVLAGLEAGITRFDSSAGGLGGCPYAPGASGNVATEDLVLLFDQLGITTGVDLRKVADASAFMFSKLKQESKSKAFQFLQGLH